MAADAHLLSRQSETVQTLRFPLMILVVLIHIPLAADYFQPIDFGLPLTYGAWYAYISRMMSYTLGHIAVPTFFVFSGYYTFAKRKEHLSLAQYRIELQKRTRTLVRPYVLWCCIPLALSVLSLAFRIGLGQSDLPMIGKLFSLDQLAYSFVTGPINFPLWYLRDLIILSILSPLIGWVVRRAPLLIAVIYLLGFCGIASVIPSSTSIIYFSLGAFFGVRRMDMVSLSARYRQILLPLFAVATLLLPFSSGHTSRPTLIALYTPIGVASMLYLGALLNKSCPRWKRFALKAEESVFFVYVAHEVMILPAVKGLFLRLGILETVPGYLSAGACVYLISVTLYYALRYIAPNALSWSLGGRS